MIRDVAILASNFIDSYDNPLFNDSGLDPFLSGAYPGSSLDALKPYGLKVMNSSLFFKLLHVDLGTPSSRIQSRFTTDDSHSRIAKLLSSVWNTEGEKRLGLLNILPLRSGTWVNANMGEVFLPTTCEIPVLPGVDMPILDPAAVANEERKTLFTQLGAVEPSIASVQAQY
jgi:hypothetical protein